MEAASGFPSDTNMLVDACIARVREAARLDDHPVIPMVLPPPLPRKERRHDVIMVPASEIPNPERIVATRAARNAKTVMTGARLAVASTPAAARAIRWPVVLCALIAFAAATASFLASPVGKRPEVQRVTSAVAHRGANVFVATKAFFQGRF